MAPVTRPNLNDWGFRLGILYRSWCRDRSKPAAVRAVIGVIPPPHLTAAPMYRALADMLSQTEGEF